MPFSKIARISRGAQHFEMDRALKDMDGLLSALYPRSVIGTTGHIFAAEAVALAEDCCPAFDFILKPAMYDLLCQPTFRFAKSSTNANEEDSGPPQPDTPFSVSGERLLQLVTARSALLQQWQIVCSRESCLITCDSEPSNTCRCAEIFPDEAFSPDEELSEAEKDERKNRRQLRMIDAWTRRIYSPPTPPPELSSDSEVEDTKRTPVKKARKSNGRSVNKEVEVPTGDRSIMSIGSLDIILGLRLLARETWEDLECKSCVRARRRKWEKKQTAIWEMLNDLFES